MLERLEVKGFKSLIDEGVDFPRLTVLFGPNAAGKSNVLDAIQALSRIGTGRTLSEALTEPIRGYPIEAFSFPAGGLPELLSREAARFDLKAVLRIQRDLYQYDIGVQVDPAAGSLSVANEYLAALTSKRQLKGNPSIEVLPSSDVRRQPRSDADSLESPPAELRIRRKSKPAHPRHEPLGLNHSLLSDPRLGGVEYRAIERCRRELSGWRTYYLDPRVAMRRAAPPADRQDIGLLGEDIAPFLYRLRSEDESRFRAIFRTLRTIIPSVEKLEVDLDKRRGTLDILVRQHGIDFSSRIVSEGTLRVLALCAIAVNPWSGSLLAFEEPENGVHPRRLELIAELLVGMATEQGKQIVVTTHSPLFCDAMLRRSKDHPGTIGLFRVLQRDAGTQIRPFVVAGPLFESTEVVRGLTADAEDGAFEGLLLRGMLDE
jgi:predicted ATPase